MVSDRGELAGIVGNIYEAVYDHRLWPALMERLRVAFDGSRSCMVRIGPDSRVNDVMASAGDPSFMGKFVAEHSGPGNPLFAAVARLPAGAIYSDHALLGAKDFRATRFWNDWMAPQDLFGGLACKLMANEQSYWFFDVQRGRRQDTFDTNDRRLFEMVMPHLTRALGIAQKFGAAIQWSAGFDSLPFGVILVDKDCRIERRNRIAGELLLSSRAVISEKSGKLHLDDPDNGAMLCRLVADACGAGDAETPETGGDLLLLRDSVAPKREGCLLSVTPLPASDWLSVAEKSAIVLIRPIGLPAHFAERARDLFHLTEREAELAASLAGGASLKEAAASLGIGFRTARSYLENIFDKMGVRQQSQLVATLMAISPFLEP